MSGQPDRLEAAVLELVAAIRAETLANVVPDPASPERLYGINEAAAVLSLGRTRVYREIRLGHIRTIRAGRRRLVPASALAEFTRAER
jgi:excisionase family DNA binding protein